jgi:methylmalonyl-CoA mutase cobalamin-binding subunit
MAQFLLVSSLEHAGATVVDGGVNRDPEDIVKLAIETAADSVVVTTHNGVARSFARKLVDEMDVARVDAALYMGGVLNEDVEGSDIPVDVRVDLHAMNVATPATIEDLVESMSGSRHAVR